MIGTLKPMTVVIWMIALAGWMVLWGMNGDSSGALVLLHWPIAVILLMGFVLHMRGGIVSSCAAAAFAVGLKLTGAVDSWTLVAWQVLIYWIFGLYPFKFMQIREQRSHHYRTLIDYKRGETVSLKGKLDEADRRCREIESQLRAAGTGGQ